MLEGLVEHRINKRRICNFEVVIPTFLEIPMFNSNENSFPSTNSISRIRICYWFSLAITFEGRKAYFKVRHFGPKMVYESKIKNSQRGEVRSKKFFQILKELIKTRPMICFSLQTDNMSTRTIRITDIFNSCKALRVPPAETRLTVYRRLQFLEILT